MDLFLVKRQLKLSLWLVGSVAILAVTFCILAHRNAEPADATHLLQCALVAGFLVLAWAGLLVWLLFVGRDARRASLRRNTPIPWGLIQLLLLATGIILLTATIVRLSIPEETPFSLLRTGQIEALRRELTAHPGLLTLPEPDSGLTLFQIAFENGNTAAVETLLQCGVTLNPAARLVLPIENESMLALLLEHGAPPDIPDAAGRTPLHRAASVGNTAALNVLLSHHAALSARNPAFQTPLMTAVMANQRPAVEVLLAAGADPNLFDKLNETALHKAVHANRPDLVRRLLDHGADHDGFNVRGRAPIHLAAMNGYHEILEYLLAIPGMVHLESENDGTAFDLALAHRKFDTARLLLKHGAAIDRIRSDGSTALHAAIRRESMAAAEFLISAGANAHLADLNQKTAYDLLKEQHLDALAAMIDRRTAPHETTKTNETAPE